MNIDMEHATMKDYDYHRQLGYKDAGALMQEDAAMEIIFTKAIVPLITSTIVD